MDHSSLAPGNEKGASSDTSHEVTLTDVHAAGLLFKKAKDRLINVNRWHDVAGKGSVVFQLTDEKGNEVFRPVELGDHFKINIPGPGSRTGKGFDWVQVEAIEHKVDETKEVFAIRVRPTNDPTNEKNEVAHFFSDIASSTFSITWTGKKVTASVQGRNEQPNTKTGSVTDKIRNVVIAAGAMLGLNKPQWKRLVKGLLR